ncbi:hypothetical protein [Algoriphagus sanaruensis]|uniref:Uncharacterized protein n=1 Tax=Algoriphagus sanaruensis TaxID=1727163 RepID=A0A142EJ03_9BACT|nr:hypothetical protein [Algoriphagus sanaruensis]AMQ55108.1 hypothetical protein AO498_01795 [Algoriphagus sanaruensis]
MKRGINFSRPGVFFSCRIYRIFLAVGFLWIHTTILLAQEIGAYKTITSGPFNQISTWSEWNGSSWISATTIPDQSRNIYIDQNHTLTLTSDGEVKSVFINAQTGAGQKLNLNGFNLDVYGTLEAFSGAAPGTPENAWTSQNWIGNSSTSTITFKGTSRVIINKNSWSAQTTQSRFSVIFDPRPGNTLTIESPLKAVSFTVRSGTLLQKLDTSVIPNVCNTLSFNTETAFYGSGPFGEMIIEDGATFISECNATILNRSTSGSVSALNFDLQNGGNLILEGSAPLIETANFQLNGTIIYRNGTLLKSFLSSSFPDATAPISIRNTEIQGLHNVILPSFLLIRGNMTSSGGGNFIATNSQLTFSGSNFQTVSGFALNTLDLSISKTAGLVSFNSDLRIQRNFNLSSGIIDLNGKNLSINEGGIGTYTYTTGWWQNVGKLTLFNIPSTLDLKLPFKDLANQGVRTIQLLGNSTGGNLSVQFFEFEGANNDPNYSDLDGTPILYQLYSFFRFSDLTPNPQSIELRISADSLIVDNVDDLRIVGTGVAAPGTHLSGQNPGLWARRSLTWSDLENQNLTIGSFREFSILPISWLDFQVQANSNGNLLRWTIEHDNEFGEFELFRSEGAELNWEKIGSLAMTQEHDYAYLDTESTLFESYFYRIGFLNSDSTYSWSPVRRVSNQKENPGNLTILPNPYLSGEVHFITPNSEDGIVQVQNHLGQVLANFPSTMLISTSFFENLAPGLYYVQVMGLKNRYSGRLWKR